MADLILGPAVRYVSDTEATVWVEVDGPCEVEVFTEQSAGGRAPTFCVDGHHYALVVVRELNPGTAHPYSVHLDGSLAWPPPGDTVPKKP